MSNKSVFNLAKQFGSLDTIDGNRPPVDEYATRTVPPTDKRRVCHFGEPRRHNWKYVISGDDVSDSSSSDDSSDDDTSWDNSSPAINSLATAIQSEFIRRLEKTKPNNSEVYRSHDSSPFRSLPKRVARKDAEPAYMSIDDEHVYEEPIFPQNGPSCANLPVKPNIPSSDLPGNALVVFCGGVQMTGQELRDLDLTRCLTALRDKQDKRFALLRIRPERFTIDECDSRDASGESSDSSDEDERKRKKGTSSSCRVGKSDEINRFGERQKFRKSLFSCMKCTSSEYQLLAHNNSIHLGSYGAIRKAKQNFEFVYKQIIFCGSSIASAPDNLLCWIYHVAKDKFTSVEFYGIECDDKQHAKSLAKSLSKQIVAKSGR
uniref:Not4 protein n=1 Tax=Phallusia mammillata TaxID=59560 RepID=A0A6F9D9U6_9ASCI|nr:not4 protein [Phallusia mammillata]